MSTWTTFAGGMLKEAPGTNELEVCSANRAPTAMTRSASRVMWLPTSVPFAPVCSAASRWSSGKAPFPIIVVTTGASSASANRMSASDAPAARTPPPARITGRRRREHHVDRGLDRLGIRHHPAERPVRGRLGDLHVRLGGLDVHRDLDVDRALAGPSSRP